MPLPRRFPWLAAGLVLAAAVALFFFWRRTTEASYGPAIALCPGPDQYGYVCAAGTSFAYIDATGDTGLYQDDGTVTVDLPFPFTFYGRSYQSATLDSNGTLQFETAVSDWDNRCLDGVLPDMGDLIAAYWDDLDLTQFGYLETETVGQPPDRIFVVEWDGVPRFGPDPDDRVTFEVQLFETSNDIVVLYQDVTTLQGSHGRSATVGLQSAEQGRALQFSCDQPSLADAGGIRFDHPDNPNERLPEARRTAPQVGDGPAAKGDAALLQERLRLNGRSAPSQLNRLWLGASAPRTLDWRWADLTGDGRDELIALWRGPAGAPGMARLAVLNVDQMLFDGALATRGASFARPALVDVADLTGDGRPDLLLHDEASGRLLALLGDELTLSPLPGRCQGNVVVRDGSGDGVLDVIGGDCEENGRHIFIWDGTQFTLFP